MNTRLAAIPAAIRIGDQVMESLVAQGPPNGFSTPGLGNGPLGGAVFLALLAKATNESRFRDAAIAIASEARTPSPHTPADGGWVAGALGIGFGLNEIGHALGSADLSRKGQNILNEGAAGADGRADVYAGLSGAILSYLRAHSLDGNKDWIALAETAAEKLIGGFIRPNPAGAYLATDEAVLFPPLGFAHGATGAAVALGALGIRTGEPLYAFLARSLLNYEDSWFRSDWMNWPDGRPPNRETGLPFSEWCRSARNEELSPESLLRPAHDFAWCSGKSGLLAGRFLAVHAWRLLQTAPGLGPDKMRDPYWDQQESTLDNYSLCCGLGGVLEVNLFIAEQLEVRKCRENAKRIAGRIIQLVLNHGDCVPDWFFEAPRPFNGLLKGRSGIGYSLLRFISPSTVPSLLLLGLNPSPVSCLWGSRERMDAFRKTTLASYLPPLGGRKTAQLFSPDQLLPDLDYPSVDSDLTELRRRIEEQRNRGDPFLMAALRRLVLEEDRWVIRDWVREQRSAAVRLLPHDQVALAPSSRLYANSEWGFLVTRYRGAALILKLEGWVLKALERMRRPVRLSEAIEPEVTAPHRAPKWDSALGPLQSLHSLGGFEIVGRRQRETDG